jgi:hypothetical protein
MQLQKIRMTLTGGLEGKTIVLRNRQFVDGVFEATIPANDLIGLKKYFTASYQVQFENLSVTAEEEPKKEVKEEVEDVKEDAEVKDKEKTEIKDEVEDVVEVKEETQGDDHAIRENDAVVMIADEKKEKEEAAVVDANLPNARQQAIIAAVNQIDKESWIEQDTNPHPKVADVASIMDDPTVTKDEIVEVIEKWLS